MELKDILLYSIIAITLLGAILVMYLLRKNYNNAMKNLDYFDKTTGLYTYEGMLRKMNQKKKKNEFISILTLDIFKCHDLENQIGSEECEKVFKKIAEVILSKLGKYRVAARYNFDVFSFVYLTNEGNKAKAIANDITIEVMRAFETQFNMDIYWGVAIGLEIEETLQKSLIAVKYAKRKKEKVLIFNEDMNRMEQSFERLLKNPAIIENEFTVYFQPKVNATTGEIEGAEALVRWIDPQGNIVMYPNDFIPEFEQNGLITNIDLFVLEELCKLLERNHKRGIKGITLSLNFSRVNFLNANFLNQVKDISSRYLFNRDFLHIEITESAYVENDELVANSILRINELGFKLEMDDFGTGYSSIGSLMNLKCNVVKMDRLFVENNLRLKSEQIFLESLVKMFVGIGLDVTVEGVESEYVVKQVRRIAPNILIQGFYFFKPMPMSKFEKILLDNRFVQDEIFNEEVSYDNKSIAEDPAQPVEPQTIIIREVVEYKQAIEEQQAQVYEEVQEEPVVEEIEVVEEEPEVIEEPVVEEEPEIIEETVIEEEPEVVEEIVVIEEPEVVEEVQPEPEIIVVEEPVNEEEEEDDEEEEIVIDEADDDQESEEERILRLIEEYKKKYQNEWEAEILKKYPDLLKKHYERLQFSEKLTKLDTKQKENYNILKNKLMRYGIKNRTTKYFDTFIYKTTVICKIGVVGKSLRLFLGLDPDAYPEGQFPHKDVSHVKRHERTPYLMKIQSDLSVRRGLRLINDLMVLYEMTEDEEYKEKNFARGIQLSMNRDTNKVANK